ncbi:hypothetical protein Bbelb_380900 [Branchiostoma belcheri]|nr:hypothetical protein Bbelb_380900 [Branchiostoma belcheri]
MGRFETSCETPDTLPAVDACFEETGRKVDGVLVDVEAVEFGEAVEVIADAPAAHGELGRRVPYLEHTATGTDLRPMTGQLDRLQDLKKVPRDATTHVGFKRELGGSYVQACSTILSVCKIVLLDDDQPSFRLTPAMARGACCMQVVKWGTGFSMKQYSTPSLTFTDTVGCPGNAQHNKQNTSVFHQAIAIPGFYGSKAEKVSPEDMSSEMDSLVKSERPSTCTAVLRNDWAISPQVLTKSDLGWGSRVQK